MKSLNDFKVAVLAADGFEESELTEPVKALKAAGAEVRVLTPDGKDIQGFKHFDKGNVVRSDGALENSDPAEFDGLMLPGGALNADKLRMNFEARRFVRTLNHANEPIAAICHAPWLLVSSGLVEGRRLTSYYTIQDDIRNAGGHWLDEDVVLDGNLVTSRQPQDIPAFNRAMVQMFSRAALRQPLELIV